MKMFVYSGMEELLDKHYSLRHKKNVNIAACSVGWFISLLVRLYEREVLLASLGEQYSCEGAGQPSQLSDHAVGLD